MQRMLLLCLPVLALLGAPAGAAAATGVSVQQVEGLDVVVASDGDGATEIETDLEIDPDTQQPYVAVRSDGGATPGAGCQEATPEIAFCVGQFDAVVVFGNGGNDEITLTLIGEGLSPLHGEAYGDAGDDTLRSPPDNRDIPQPDTYMEGGAGNDTIVGGNGPDELHGGDGNDTMQAFQGPDLVYGEGGDDSVSAGKEEPEANSADLVDGGPGFDLIPDVDADYNRGFDDDVSVSVNGVADDGELSEGDNVIAVEKLRVTADHATVIGSDAADDIFVEANTSTIRGLGGNDRLVAYDGHDSIEGGDGDDYLEGGFGNDTLDGGAGVDQFSGDRTETNVIAIGNDQIRARDGAAEQVSCGIGSDSAQVDASDVVDLTCESVDRPPGPDPEEPGSPRLVGKRSIQAIASGGLLIRISCPAACEVSAELRVSKAAARKLGLGRSRVLARGARKLSAAGDARVKLKVVKKARKRFKRQRRLKVTLRTRTTMGGETTPTSRKLTLKRAAQGASAAQALPPCGSEQMQPELEWDASRMYATHTYRADFRFEPAAGASSSYEPVNVQVSGPPGVVRRVSAQNRVLVVAPQAAGALPLTMSWDQQDLDSGASTCSASTTVELQVLDAVPIAIKRLREGRGRSAYLNRGSRYAFGIVFSLAAGKLDQYDDYEVDGADLTPVRVEARAVAGAKAPGQAVEAAVLEYVPGARKPRRAERGLVRIVRRNVFRFRGLETIEVLVSTRKGVSSRGVSITLTQGTREIGSFTAAGRCRSEVVFGSPLTACHFNGRHSWLWAPCRPVTVKGRFVGCRGAASAF